MSDESRVKPVLKWILLTYVVVTFGTIVYQDLSTPSVERNLPPWPSGVHYYLVTYFHAHKRCTTCNNMEAFTFATLDQGFPSLVEQKQIQRRRLNWELAKNAAYKAHYGLLGNAVILSEIKEGRELRWQNLAQVWDHAHDRKAFMAYIQRELTNFIEGLPAKRSEGP